MRKRNVGIVLAAAAMLLQLVGSAGPAMAQAVPDVTFSFSPTSGLAGTKIAFTGTGCVHDATKTFDGTFFLTSNGSNPVGATVQFVSAADGSFSGMYDTTGLAPAQYTTFAACTNTSKGGPGSPFTVTAPVIPGSTYFPLSPARILDTRDGTGTGGVNPIGAGGVIDVKVTGVGGVPTTGVTAVALNVVTTNASGPPSYLTVWPTGASRPLASNLNFTQGVSVPNLVIARVGTDGKVSMYNNLGSVNVAADVQGWFSDPSSVGSTYVPLAPARILDTRNGTGAAQAQVGPGSTIELTVTNAAGVPASGVTAVALNVTATNVSGAESFLTVWPSGASRPVASNLNFIAGQTVPNLVIARVGDGGKISIYNNLGTVDVVADTQGYFAAPVTAPAVAPGAVYFPQNPVRVLDSRDGTGVPGGAMGQLGTGGTLDVQVTGLAGVPANATAVALNVTAADSPGPDSYLTVYPTGTTRPLASNLNFVAGQTIPNMVIAKVGTGGKVTLYNNLGSTVVIADVQGYFTS
jgi:hypothetical protein